MVHRILIVTSVLFALSQGSCRSKPSSDREASISSPEQGGTEVSAAAEALSNESPTSKSTIGSGTMTVFGIKIPTGMSPAKGPDKVYRFEGKLKVERTAMLVRDQITAEKEEKENLGVLFRFAASKKLGIHTKNSDNSHALAIRVFPTSNGSALDIWLEKEYAETLPDIHSTTSIYSEPMLPKANRIVLDKAAQEKQRQNFTTLLRALQKIERGEKLTPEEAASGVMD
jgi:hypothetical protein